MPDGRLDSDAGQKPADLLVFPAELSAENPSVNEFVRRAMTDCASGDYDTFRLLWSVHQEPLPRDEFERGWQAVREIRIRALEKVILDTDPQRGREQRETVYVMLAGVSLDPSHPAGRREPDRDVVLMLVREADSWRLSSAPRRMRAWVRDRAGEADTTSNGPQESPVDAAEPE